MEHRQSPFVSKLPMIMATIGERKAQLAAKKQELLETKCFGRGTEQLTNQLGIEWGILESEIDLLEHTANVMRMDLIHRGLPVNGHVEADEDLKMTKKPVESISFYRFL